MKKLFGWFFSLFVNKKKTEVKEVVNTSKIVGVSKVLKKELINNTVIMGKNVDCVISVHTNNNESVKFEYHFQKKLLVMVFKNQTFDFIKIEYIKVKE